MDLEVCIERGLPPPGHSVFEFTPHVKPLPAVLWSKDPRVPARLNGWDSRFHVKASRANEHVGHKFREYFDQPRSLTSSGRIMLSPTKKQMSLNGTGHTSLAQRSYSVNPTGGDPGRPSQLFGTCARTLTSAPLAASRHELQIQARTMPTLLKDSPQEISEIVQGHRDSEAGWNIRHHVATSKNNDELHCHYRSFFDRPAEFGHGITMSPKQTRMHRTSSPWEMPHVSRFEKSWRSTKVQYITGSKNRPGAKVMGGLWGMPRMCTAPSTYSSSTQPYRNQT